MTRLSTQQLARIWVAKNTVVKLPVDLGTACAAYQDAALLWTIEEIVNLLDSN